MDYTNQNALDAIAKKCNAEMSVQVEIKVGDTVSINGKTDDCYTVEEINADGVASLHWECGQYTRCHVSKLFKPEFVYFGSKKYKVVNQKWVEVSDA